MNINSLSAATRAIGVLGIMTHAAHADVFHMGAGLKSLAFVSVGDAGNAGELSGTISPPYIPADIVGRVNYRYRIGRYEVTAGQYTEFLNAVAVTDTFGLYNPNMADSATHNVWGCNIQRDGSPGTYQYRVDAGSANRPVNWVSWGDAARFANWLHNGQRTGMQNLSTTEDGPYHLNGATSDAALMAVTVERNARYAIPNEDEWYKAAYHKNDGMTGEYWDYPTSSNNAPSNKLLGSDPRNNATFYDGATWPDPIGYTIGDPFYRTVVGEHENTKSPYGAFDMAGNVWEWTETAIATADGPRRAFRGGSFTETVSDQRADYRLATYPTHQSGTFGFRIAAVSTPAPSADFDQDGDVDGADFLAWQRHSGGAGNLSQGDADDDGQVTADDLAVWRQQFGNLDPPLPAIPEPTAASLLLGGILAALSCRRTLAPTCA